jgi:hypothetical protein
MRLSAFSAPLRHDSEQKLTTHPMDYRILQIKPKMRLLTVLKEKTVGSTITIFLRLSLHKARVKSKLF